MGDSSIETFVKLQYDLLKWFTAGWAIWFGGFIVKDMIDYPFILGLLILLGFIGWLMFVVNLLKLLRLNKQLNTDEKSKNALADELALHHKSQAFFIGFWTLIISIAAFLIIALFMNVSPVFVCQMLLFIGVLVPSIAFLILNKP